MESYCEICFAYSLRGGRCKIMEPENARAYKGNQKCPFFKTTELYQEQLKKLKREI